MVKIMSMEYDSTEQAQLKSVGSEINLMLLSS